MSRGSEGGGKLRREVGLAGAILLGLGSMVGTGVFVSVGIAAGVAGSSLVGATLLAALVATANGLSSAQLAARHPVSGGTYEYGYLRLSPAWGFSAGWMFLLAKGASAATAALGLAGYALEIVGVSAPGLHLGVAVGACLAITGFVAGGIRRSNVGNAVVVGITLAALASLLVTAVPAVLREDPGAALSFFPAEEGAGGTGLLHGAALMFVAFTGYGRIATLGEEVLDPRRVIPRAVILTMALVTLVYAGVGYAGVGVLGPERFANAAERTAAPLEAVSDALDLPWLGGALSVGAVTAMAGVLLNLVLGLSRVLLAMARRGDAPRFLRRVDGKRGSPVASVWVCGLGVAALALLGNVRVTWSFSAFTVLLYYGITNLAALRLEPQERLFPRWIPVGGLIGCVGLAFWVEPGIWLAGLALLGSGLVVHRMRHAWFPLGDSSEQRER